MRVGVDWRPAVWGRGGIATYVREFVGAYATRFPDDTLRLYAHRWRRGGAAKVPPPPGARVASTPLPSRAADVLARFGVGADRLVGGCDVFHLTDYALLRPTHARLVATVHDVLFAELPRCYTAPMRRGLGAATRALVARADRVVVPSLRTKVALVERFGADPTRVDVTPLGVRPAPAARAAGAGPAPRPYVLAVGTLEPRKNHLRLLAAHRAALARGLDVDLVVAGARGWLDDAVVAALATAPRVRWEKRPDATRLAVLVAGAAGLAYPSLGEGFGLPVLEAMAAGVPVLTTAAVPALERAPDAALLVDPYDVDAMATGLARLVEDGALRARLVARGRAAADACPWTRAVEATRAAYLRAVA